MEVFALMLLPPCQEGRSETEDVIFSKGFTDIDSLHKIKPVPDCLDESAPFRQRNRVTSG